MLEDEYLAVTTKPLFSLKIYSPPPAPVHPQEL